MPTKTQARQDSTARAGAGASHVLLITGKPGIGKTTVIQRVVARLRTCDIRGFYTEEIREGGVRQGFRLVGFDKMSCVIAHVDFPKTKCVGKYGVDVEAIDAAATMLRPDPAANAYLVDEIGKMECLSHRFVDTMRMLIAGDRPVIATVGKRGSGFIAEVKRMPECTLWDITRANRDAMPEHILAWLDAVPGRMSAQ